MRINEVNLNELLNECLSRANYDKIYGVIIFGSIIDNKCLSGYSDIDIALFHSDELIDHEIFDFNGFNVELFKYPINTLYRVLYDNSIRNKDDTWFKCCFWLKLLRCGLIIYDPDKLLNRLKEKSLKWKWSEMEKDFTRTTIFRNVNLARKLLREGDLINSIIAIRDSLNLILVYKFLKNNLIPSYRPKDLYNHIRMNNDEGFLEFYDYVMGLNNLNEEYITRVFNIIRNVYSIRMFWNHYIDRIFKDVFKSFSIGDFKQFLLCARYLLLRVMEEILLLKGFPFKIKYFNFDSHMVIMNKTSLSNNDLLKYYYELHGVNLLDKGYISDCIDKIKKEWLSVLS